MYFDAVRGSSQFKNGFSFHTLPSVQLTKIYPHISPERALAKYGSTGAK